MNQELLDLLRDILSQFIAGIPFGAILSLIIYYALDKIKKKTSEFPEKAKEIEVKVKDFSKEVKQGLNDIKQEVTEIVNDKLEDFEKKAEEYQKIINDYKKELIETNKINEALFYQQEITLDVLKKYVCENKNAVISGLAKDVSEVIENYKERTAVVKEIMARSPEIKEKVVYILNNYPDVLIKKLSELPISALEEMIIKYEKEKS